VKDDSRAWLSLTAVGLNQQKRRELSEQIVSVLTNAGLRLASIKQAENLEPAERLLRGEALYVESDAV
jgi:predicted ATPase with chaperone activity